MHTGIYSPWNFGWYIIMQPPGICGLHYKTTTSTVAVTGADDGGSGMTMVVGPPVPPEGPGLGMNTGEGDLLRMILLRLLRSASSPLRNV